MYRIWFVVLVFSLVCCLVVIFVRLLAHLIVLLLASRFFGGKLPAWARSG